MNVQQTLAPLGALSTLFLVAACSLAPVPSVPEPVAELPDSFEGDEESGAYGAGGWWTTFQDPAINTVIDLVLAANFDLAEAVARVQQAKPQAGIARASLLPSIQAGATVSSTDNPSNVGFGQWFRVVAGDRLPGFEFSGRIGIETWSLGVDFAYELDFWERAGNDSRAAGHEYPASKSDYHAARIGARRAEMLASLSASGTVGVRSADADGQAVVLSGLQFATGDMVVRTNAEGSG